MEVMASQTGQGAAEHLEGLAPEASRQVAAQAVLELCEFGRARGVENDLTQEELDDLREIAGGRVTHPGQTEAPDDSFLVDWMLKHMDPKKS